ncbi:MAG: SGNH/GDSL hydrolase family protein [Calditrichia bacterium]
MAKKLVFIATLSFLMLLLVLSAGELLTRYILGERLNTYKSERDIAFQYDAELGWRPRSNIHIGLTASREIQVRHNSRGFRDYEKLTKRPKILFLGDSFVWGYDANSEERFTNLLQDSLPNWQMINLGVSGYGMDQAFLLLKEQLEFYKPKVVFWLISKNDRQDNSTNQRYGGFYKPYSSLINDSLSFAGKPVPLGVSHYFNRYPMAARSYLFRAVLAAWLQYKHPVKTIPDPSHAILDAAKDYLSKQDIQLLIGFNYLDPAMQEHCKKIGLSFINLQNKHYYPSYGSHWTPEGHQYARDGILKLFEMGGFLQQRSKH